MSRIAARVRHDEIARMVKAVRSCGLPVSSVTFDGQTVRVNIGESGGNQIEGLDGRGKHKVVQEVETL